jgi:hypothetical protein
MNTIEQLISYTTPVSDRKGNKLFPELSDDQIESVHEILKASVELKLVLDHAAELGYIGCGSTFNWAKLAIKNFEKVAGVPE